METLKRLKASPQAPRIFAENEGSHGGNGGYVIDMYGSNIYEKSDFEGIRQCIYIYIYVDLKI